MNSNEHLRGTFESIIKRVDDAIQSDDAQFLTCALLHIRSAAKHMLLLPRRNCDVGTAEEQVKRFSKFCLPRKCEECPLNNDANFFQCGVRWSQLPYEEVKE